MIINHTSDYKERRAAVYPNITDQIDAIYKMAKSLNDQGINLPPEVLDWISSVQLVKDTYPKEPGNGY